MQTICFPDATLSTDNYDALLIGWDERLCNPM